MHALLASANSRKKRRDGANLGFSASEEGELQAQNRGNWLSPDTCHPQFRPLWPWLGLRRVPEVGRGRFSHDELVARMTTSRVGSVPMEGIYVRVESTDWLSARAKLVREEFVQAIDTHWSLGPLRRNRLAHPVRN